MRPKVARAAEGKACDGHGTPRPDASHLSQSFVFNNILASFREFCVFSFHGSNPQNEAPAFSPKLRICLPGGERYDSPSHS